MANQVLYKDTPIDSISFNAVNHYDLSLDGKRCIIVQFDPLTNPSARLYFRIDTTSAAGGTTLALFKPEGYLTKGGDAGEFWVDPNDANYLHLLLTDSAGTALAGGASDRALVLPYKH